MAGVSTKKAGILKKPICPQVPSKEVTRLRNQTDIRILQTIRRGAPRVQNLNFIAGQSRIESPDIDKRGKQPTTMSREMAVSR
jgi:hypothetical protein